MTGLPTSTGKTPSDHSSNASPVSTAENLLTEKLAEPTTHRLKHKPQSIGLQERDVWLRDGRSLSNGTYGDSMAPKSPITTVPRKPKNRGFGTIIRRIFGRSKDRISMLAPRTYQNVSFDKIYQCCNKLISRQKNPNSFITSAADLRTPRAASAPTQDISRSSALGSHAPHSTKAPSDNANTEIKAPARPERSPERLALPRQSSLPNVTPNLHEKDGFDDVPTGLGLQDFRDNAADRSNIGYAVTTGGNPKRRSRSAGNFRDTAEEHRMSPIQWRQWRRRSDEIRYWRESTDVGSPVLGNPTYVGSEQLQMMSPARSRDDGIAKESPETSDELDTGTERNHDTFNFGVPTSEMGHPEQVSIEERMVTLEIKLMDFEYAISKLQAGLASSSSHTPHQFHPNEEPRTVRYSNHPQTRPMSPRYYHAKRPSDESYSPRSIHSTPAPQSYQYSFQTLTNSPAQQQHNENRPASAANTVRAGARDRSSRFSAIGLTIDHYTTLVTLFRNERASRIRLEEQVSLLQRQINLLQSSPWPHHDTTGIRGGLPLRISSPRDSGEESARGGYRKRSRTYSEREADTDEASLHEVYATPLERGEFERARLNVEEEGVAF